jgi:hypothetical protein
MITIVMITIVMIMIITVVMVAITSMVAVIMVAITATVALIVVAITGIGTTTGMAAVTAIHRLASRANEPHVPACGRELRLTRSYWVQVVYSTLSC